MKIFFTGIVFLFYSSMLIGQSSIYGKVTDEASGEVLIYANIILEINGVFQTGVSTDFDGNYSLSVDPGTYDVIVSYTGYSDLKIEGAIVSEHQTTKLNMTMLKKKDLVCCYLITYHYTIPLIQIDQTSSGETTSQQKIRNTPIKKINEIILNTPGVSIDNF